MIELNRDTVLASLRNLDNPRLVLRPEDAPRPEHIPPAWWPMLSLDGVDHDRLAALWGPLPAALPEMWQQLTRALRGLAVLLEDNHPPALLYLYSERDRLYHHRGQPPITAGHAPNRLNEVWASWPAVARTLYEVHNGWTLLHSHSMGHLSVSAVLPATDPAVGLSGQEGPLPFVPRRTVLLYSNGGGSYLCLEAPSAEDEAARAFVWSPGIPSEIGLSADFAAIYDAWTAIHFEGMDSAK